jgi:hypothetical protein
MRVSKYHYIRREQAKGILIDNPDWHLARKVDLDEFVASPDRDYSEHIDVPIDRFAFVGHVDHLDSDVAKLCDQFLGTRYSIPTSNSNPEGKTYELEKHTAAYIKSSASQMHIYEKLCERRKLLLS